VDGAQQRKRRIAQNRLLGTGKTFVPNIRSARKRARQKRYEAAETMESKGKQDKEALSAAVSETAEDARSAEKKALGKGYSVASADKGGSFFSLLGENHMEKERLAGEEI